MLPTGSSRKRVAPLFFAIEPMASIIGALEGMKNYDTGLMAPLSFAADRHAGALSGAITKAQGGKWKIISGWLSAE